MNHKVNFFFEKDSSWKKEYAKLRLIVLDTELNEELKWGVPCYTLAKKNVVLIHGFKDYCALLFHKGALLKDPEKRLIQQTENVQAARQLRFTSLDEIIENEKLIKAMISDAIDVEKSGKEVTLKKTSEFSMPEEFRQALENHPQLKTAFENLSPGRQRAYLLHFSQAKQSKTRQARIDKYIPKILDGLGFHD